LIELSRKYRAIREPIRLSVRQWYALILRVRRRKYAGSLSSTQPDGAAVGVSPGECLFSSAYDVESLAWASNVLHHNLRADFPIDDPEAKHDVVRLRGVLGVLAGVFAASRSDAVRDRIEFLLKGTITVVESDPSIGWDATNAALRLLSLLGASEILRSCNLSLPAASGLLRDFVSGHREALRLGRIVEPEGNHRLINVVGRAAFHLLVCPDLPLPASLAAEFALTFEKQFLPDGGHIERSPHYHAESVVIASQIADVDASRGGILAPTILPTLNRATRALAVTLSPSGIPTRFGDISRTFSGKSVSCDVAGILDRADRGGPAGELPSFGLVHSCWGGRDERFSLMFDCGPMGFGGNPGHGHADMLSFCFWAKDHELIGDPGTFLYADTPEAMEFKLRGAHNCIDWPAHPSSRLSRYFRWRLIPPPPTLARRETAAGQPCLSADHGWRLGFRHYHQNRTWIPLLNGLAVLDRVNSSTPENAFARLHLHPDARANVTAPNTVNVDHPSGTARISIFGVDRSWIDEAWYAPRYGFRLRAPVVCSSFVSGPAQSTILTLIELPE